MVSLRLAVVSVFSLFSAPLLATPMVSGQTISWPDNGWYQVQRIMGDTVQEVCQGGRSCEVAPGEYIVINHSTGERFESVRVGDIAQPSGIVVTGNTISWPDDGWYQVQNETTYTEVCSGTRSCDVEPGLYVVINHTTGERFAGIVVQGDTTDSPITVTGNAISWPDDGWYQIQDEVSYSTVCSGGRYCIVEPGRYTVINHTTGEHYPGIIVTDQSTSAPAATLISQTMPDSSLNQVITQLSTHLGNTLVSLNQRLSSGEPLSEREEYCLGTFEPGFGQPLTGIDCGTDTSLVSNDVAIFINQASFNDTESCRTALFAGSFDSCTLQTLSASLNTYWIVPNRRPVPQYPATRLEYALDGNLWFRLESNTGFTQAYRCAVDLRNAEITSEDFFFSGCDEVIDDTAQELNRLLGSGMP